MAKGEVHEVFGVLTVKKVSVAFLALLASSCRTDADNKSWTSCDECLKANQVCCTGSCVFGSSCLGLSCSSDLDCLSGESCCSKTCVNESNCVGQNCSSHSDCGSNESCCGTLVKYYNHPRKCKSGNSCIGIPCGYDSDCAVGETCCGECVSYDCSALVTSLFFLGPLAGIIVIYFVCFLRGYLYTKCTEFYDWINRHLHLGHLEISARGFRLVRQRETTAQGTSSRYSSPHLGRSSPSTQQTDPGYTTPPYEQILLVQLNELPPPSASAQTEVTAQCDSANLGQSRSPYDQSSPSPSSQAYEQIPPGIKRTTSL